MFCIIIFFSQSTLYIFGGRIGKKATNQLWSFDTEMLEWDLVTSDGDSPLYIAGHTATLVDSTMIVLFGFGPNRGYTDRVQEFDLGKILSIVHQSILPIPRNYSQLQTSGVILSSFT